MPIALEITLILVLVAVAVTLVPLLYQLRRTAQNLDLFLHTTRRDLTQITEDVHATRLRVDHLANSLAGSLTHLSLFARSIGDVGTTVSEWHARFRNSIDSVSCSLGGLLGGLSAVLAFFKSKPTQQEPE